MWHRASRLFGERKRRILLVEDHPVTREGLARLLNQQPDLEVCGQAGTAPEALTAAEALKPDLVVVDISLGGPNGIEFLKNLSSRQAKLPALVLSTHDELLYAGRCLRAGARGYVMKQASTEQIMAAIRLVLRGGVYLSDQMHNRLLQDVMRKPALGHLSEVDRLSDRELEVFQLIGEGCTTSQIAARLHLGVSTVETHRAHIKEKLKLASGAELMRRGFEWVQSAAPGAGRAKPPSKGWRRPRT